jgi:phosphatidylethanolamine/phosphatidyl-N-methylethanolamine N-methyltransferase
MIRIDATAPISKLQERVLFLSRWLKTPAAIGAILPSGRRLARVMAAEAVRQGPGPVIEIGAGTGVVTEALLELGVAPDQLIAVERDPALFRLLADRFPNILVIQGDATKLSELVAPHLQTPARAVVSGLPMLSLPAESCRAVLEQSLAVMAKDGLLVQYTYAWTSPVSRRMMTALGLSVRPVAFVARNLPPATVWAYQRIGAAKRRAA